MSNEQEQPTLWDANEVSDEELKESVARHPAARPHSSLTHDEESPNETLPLDLPGANS